MDSTAEARISPPLFTEIESQDFCGLLPLLQRLDRYLERLSIAHQELESTGVEQAEFLFETALEIRADSPVAWLQKTYKLSLFELDILAIALAPEIDSKYVEIFGLLQNDMSLNRPTVDLVLNLLCPIEPERLLYRRYFATTAPLFANNLLYLSAESQSATLLKHNLIVDDLVVRFLLQQPGLDSRLTACSQLIPPIEYPHSLYLKSKVQEGLKNLFKENCQQPLIVYFSESDRTTKRHTAENLAADLQVSLLVFDLGKAVRDKAEFEDKLRLALREAWLFGHLLYLDNFDLLYLQEHQTLYHVCLEALVKNKSITILAGVEPWKASVIERQSIINIPFPIPKTNQRRDCWQTHLQQAQISLEDRELDLLSDRFALTPDRIGDAIITAQNNVRWQSLAIEEDRQENFFLNLCNAARQQSSLDLGNLAYKVEPKYTWDDIILHGDRLQQLRDICQEWEYKDLVHRQWGFADKLSLGKGLNVLFAGASGTGKTMAAEVIANHLRLDLYKIDLSQIISKYIGETEKNLNLIFTAASNSNAILLFDEADALFGKRSEVNDARDRYANIEVGYLLQKMEEYTGIAILTTNLNDNLDRAFERRLRFTIKFNLPDAPCRHQIWQQVFSQNAPCGSLDLKFLADTFELTGASIRNIALTAAFLAADDASVIEMKHIIKALQREYQKTGQILRAKDLGKYGN